MQLILSIYHVTCSVTSKINIKNSAKFNICSTSRLTYDIISQLHLPQNGYFMERSNFLVAIIMLMLRSLAIIPAWFVSLRHEIVTFLFQTVYFLEIWGNAGDAFSSTFVGKYGFGHCDLNLPQSQLFAGRYGKQPIWNIILKTPTSTSLSRSTSGVTTYKPKTRKHISWWELWSAWWRVNTYFHHAHWVSLQSFPCLDPKQIIYKTNS